MRSLGGGWLRRHPAGVQERLLALLLTAVVPLFILGSWLAWQNYRVLAGQPQRRVELTYSAVAARYQAVIDDAARELTQISRDPALTDGNLPGCDLSLQRAHEILHAQFGGFLVTDASGAIRCAATDAARVRRGQVLDVAASALRIALSRPFSIVLIGAGEFTHLPVLVTSTRLPTRADESAGDLMVASLKLGWLTQPTYAPLPEAGVSVWFIDDANTAMPIGDVAADAFPSATELATVEQSANPVLLTNSAGDIYAYKSAVMITGLRLLVGMSATADIAAARLRLGYRFAELAAVVAGGLIAVTLGANMTVVVPVKRLSAAVQKWRSGGTFDAMPPEHAPREVHELAISFSQAAASLAEREKQLRVASTQQDLLMQEIHHRVKNNLQIIASLLNLQASRIRQPQAKAEFQSARDRIRALATLHRHLYAHNELHTINMRSFLNELCGQLVAAIGDRPGDHTPERVEVQIDATELQISSDQAVPIALIVTEAVSNAAKYAFPGGRSGHIWVTLTTRDAHALLVIRDDGVGIPAGRADTETGVRDGIGIQLIRGFARQLGATLTVMEEQGTCYEIDIPLRRAREPDAQLAEVAAGE